MCGAAPAERLGSVRAFDAAPGGTALPSGSRPYSPARPHGHRHSDNSALSRSKLLYALLAALSLIHISEPTRLALI
eukprot:13491622-Alexandrium_andersonii.AAC.1